MKIFGIRNKQTKQPLRVSTFSNEGGEFCNAVGAMFEYGDFYETVYIVASYEVAARALESDPRWYNASLERPQWPNNFDPAAWEVFVVKLLTD